MAFPPTPRSTPPASTTMPPPHLVTLPKVPEQKLKQGDKFLSLLQGPAVIIIVGPKTYTLPIAMLCAHSTFFRDEIMRSCSTPRKKRKLSPSTIGEQDEEPSEIIKDEEMDKNMRAEKRELVLTLEDVDPNIFGLFLKFIFAGGYSPAVDARPVTAAPMSKRPDAAYPSPFPAGPPSAPNTNIVNTYALPNTAPAVSTNRVRDLPIPPSIRACLLAQRLNSISFMNHTLARIYNAIGVHFTLSPSLIDFVWINTKTASTSKTESEAEQPNPADVRALQAPLRKLLLDILIMHWPTQHTHIIARNDDDAWNAVFDAHQDLRRGFILGLQGGMKVMPVQGYFTQAVVVKQDG